MRSSLTGILAFILAAGLFVALSYAPPDGFADAELHDAPPGSHEAPAPRAPEALSTTRVGARATSNEPITFATLEGEQRIEVVLRSTGCFNRSHHKLVFRKAERLVVDVARVDNSGVENALGSKELEVDDAGRLEMLLAFYRGLKGHAGCTSVDDVEVTYVVDGRPVATESFSDDTCSIDQQKDLLSFGAIVVDVQARYESALDKAAE